MSSVSVRNLSKSFDAPVLRDLDLLVPQGAVTAILGSSGSGKSTLLRCIAGLTRPDSGTIALDDDLVNGPGRYRPPERRNVGLVPQEGALFPHLNVADNVGFGLRGKDRTQRIEQLLELVGLPGTGRMRPHELSGGMQQRVAVARALAPRPAVILLDEPFSALDAGLRDDVRADVFGAIRQDGTTALLVTHDQQEAFSVADRVAVMLQGVIAQDAAPAEVYRSPASLGVATFVGETVCLTARATGDGLVHTAVGTLPADGARQPGDGVLVFRPEQLSLHPPGNVIAAGAVTDIRYQGHDSLIEVRLGDQPVTVRALGPTNVSLGQQVDVRYTSPGRFFPQHPNPLA